MSAWFRLLLLEITPILSLYHVGLVGQMISRIMGHQSKVDTEVLSEKGDDLRFRTPRQHKIFLHREYGIFEILSVICENIHINHTLE